MTSLHINKLAAVKRQLQASIRMYFMLEDDLAVHTIASAAYSLLKDIKRARGKNEAAERIKTTYFYLVRDYRRGINPLGIAHNAEYLKDIENIANQLSFITADSTINDFEIQITPSQERQYWSETNQAANFLKHADRDAEEILSLDAIDNPLLLSKCFCAYQEVAPDDLGNEGLVFQAYITSSNPAYQVNDTAYDSMISSMQSIQVADLKSFCWNAILELNRKNK